MSPVIEKIWGTTEPLILTPLFEMHRLIIKPEHRCSLHMHRFKHNAFYVLDGNLYIDQVVADLMPTDTLLIGPGQVAFVRPGVHHQFRTGRLPCMVLEMYYTEPLSDDIIRRNVGGPT
jgi:mannose-6-phosphate isomerase-like protein (cupin superfamily)